MKSRIMLVPVICLVIIGSIGLVLTSTLGAETAPQFDGSSGNAKVTSDFNNDGFDDLAIGVPGESIGALDDAGAVNVLYGSAAGLQVNAPNDQIWHQDQPDVEGVAEAGDRFGSSLATGDFNNDGFGDLAIGVPGESIGVRNNAGAVNVLYGSAVGLRASAPNDQIWHQDQPGVEGAAEPGDLFGSAIAAGDFNNDGSADLAIGVPGESIGVRNNAGAVNVLYGSAVGLRVNGTNDQIWHQNQPNVEGAAEPGDLFGSAVASGDFNNDGLDDLAIGVPGEGIGALDNAGAVNVLHGSPVGLRVSAPNDQIWHQNQPSVEGVAEAGDLFGSAVASGDFNNDGSADLAIGVPGEGIGALNNAGAVNMLYGSLVGLKADTPDDQIWHQDQPSVEGVAETGDRFGAAVGAGDFNNDGLDDLAIGVPGEGIGALNNAGAVNLLYGSAGLRANGPNDQIWEQDQPNVEGVAEADDLFGSAVSAGDFNNDGFDDLAIGVPGESIGVRNNAGAVNVLYGSAVGVGVSAPNDQIWHQDQPGVEGAAEAGDRFGAAVAVLE